MNNPSLPNMENLYCVFEHDGYGIGSIRGNKFYLTELDAQDRIPVGDEIACVKTVREALDEIQDGYWAETYKRQSGFLDSSIPLAPDFFKSTYFRELHKNNNLDGISILEQM